MTKQRRKIESSLREAAGFTLIELLVVIGIVMIILAIALPGIAALSRGNNVKSGSNMVTAYLASARSSALSLKRQVAVVFYEETKANAAAATGGLGSSSVSQTAMQIVLEDGNQTQYSPSAGNTVFVPYRTREYLPTGVRVATVSAVSMDFLNVVESTDTTRRARAIVFGADGQLVVRTGLACTLTPSPGPQLDWGFITPTGTSANASSSPAMVIFDGPSLKAANITDDALRSAWLQKNADVVVINTYTGNRIR